MTTEPTKSFVLAQLGCGYWGPNLLRNFYKHPNCKVKWVAELSPQRRKFVEDNFPGVATTGDWEQVFQDKEVEGVVIATTASSHYTLAKAALKHGKHIFVEKPLAMTTAEADDLVALAKEGNRVLMVGHTYLYHPAIRYLKNLIDREEAGQLYYIYCHRLNLGQVRKDVNVWWNLGPHDVSVLLYLMNNQLPDTVSAVGMDYLQRGIEDVSFVTLTWNNRMMAHVQLSWLDPHKVRKMTIVGSKKMITYDDIHEDKIAIFNKGVDRIPVVGEKMDYDDLRGAYQLQHRAGDILLPKVNFEEPLRIEANHFLECCTQGVSAITGPRHARDVVAILEAGDRALKTGQRIAVVPQNAANF